MMSLKSTPTLYVTSNSPSSTEEIDTLVTAFLLNYVKLKHINVVLVGDENPKLAQLFCHVDSVKNVNNVDGKANMCALPCLVVDNGFLVVAGLCAVLRWIVKDASQQQQENCRQKDNLILLLGFRQGCLRSCAEVSSWTKFCEVEVPLCAQNVLRGETIDKLPEELSRLETHLKEPSVIHNINKRKQKVKREMGQISSTDAAEVEKMLGSKEKLSRNYEIEGLEHAYAEGADFTLTDLVLFPCVHIILKQLQEYSRSTIHISTISRVVRWYNRIQRVQGIIEAATSCGFKPKQIIPVECPQNVTECGLENDVKQLSLRVTTQKVKMDSDEITSTLNALKEKGVDLEVGAHPYTGCVTLDWQSMPDAVHPAEGNLPPKRVARKCEQLENLALAVKSVAKSGDTIVDFCSGGGHLGILIASLLPECHVILVENKEESITRALVRVQKLQLSNVTAYQCNLGYFTGNFTIGTCLHACGVASDLVLQKCLDKHASFVICPCCYGNIQNTHSMTYPRSQCYTDTAISYQNYTLLCHAADKHDGMGKKCMQYIDYDRLLAARELGYSVTLCSLEPLTCTPKNNLIIGTLS